MKFLSHAKIALRDLFLYALDGIVRPFIRPQSKAGGVLCVRLDAIGDFVIWLDSARELRRMYKQTRLSLVCDASVQSLASDVGLFEEIIPVETRRFRNDLKYRRSIVRRVRANSYDKVIHPILTRDGDFSDGESIVRCAHAKEKIGFAALPGETGWRTRLSNGWYTHLIKSEDRLMMELCRNAEFVRGLGNSAFKADLPVLDVAPNSPADGPFYVLFPGAGAAGRRWPIDRFAEIARRIHAETGWSGVICGGPGDRELAGKMMQFGVPELQDHTGKTSLMGLAGVIAAAKLIVCNDTSAVHFAAAVGTPAVCIMGMGHPGRFLPYEIEKPARSALPLSVYQPIDCHDCNWKCIHPVAKDAPFPCVDVLTVDMVWNAVKPQLATESRKETLQPLQLMEGSR